MNRIFGTKKPKAPPVDLSDVGGKVDSRTAHLDGKIKELDNELRGYQKQLKRAKGASATNIKRRAMQVLKRKKMYEQQRDQLCAQSFNIEQASFAIDSVKSTQETVSAMKDAAKQLKVESAKIDLSAVEDTQDDMEELLFDMNEIQETLGRSYGVPDEFDEADLEDELAALDDLDLEDDIAEGTGAPAMPSYLEPAPAMPVVPTDVPAVPAGGEAVDEFGLPVAPQQVAGS
eukprot:g1440.t1